MNNGNKERSIKKGRAMENEIVKLLKGVRGLWLELQGEAYYDCNGGQDFDQAIELLESEPEPINKVEPHICCGTAYCQICFPPEPPEFTLAIPNNRQEGERMTYKAIVNAYEREVNRLTAENQKNLSEIDRLTTENDQIKALLKVAGCPNCNGSGIIPHQISSETRVSKDMALDAGMPELEGSIYPSEQWDAEQCQWCYEKEQALKGESDGHKNR